MARRRPAPRRWECPDCETVIVGGAACPTCHRPAPALEPRREDLHPVHAPETWTPSVPPPCTEAQTRAAHAIIRAILAGELTTEQGHDAMRALFPGADGL